MQAFVAFLNRLVREEEGQDMVEYALILGLVSIIAVAAVTTTGTSVQSIWNTVSSEVAGRPEPRSSNPLRLDAGSGREPYRQVRFSLAAMGIDNRRRCVPLPSHGLGDEMHGIETFRQSSGPDECGQDMVEYALILALVSIGRRRRGYGCGRIYWIQWVKIERQTRRHQH